MLSKTKKEVERIVKYQNFVLFYIGVEKVARGRFDNLIFMSSLNIFLVILNAFLK